MISESMIEEPRVIILLQDIAPYILKTNNNLGPDMVRQKNSLLRELIWILIGKE